MKATRQQISVRVDDELLGVVERAAQQELLTKSNRKLVRRK
jgi:hypothetical protein